MFRHRGKGRSFRHNLKLASILSAVAGIVNITSLLKLNTLTTNITGHFAYFSEQLIFKNYRMALVYMLFVFFFLSGAFVSSLIMELLSKYKPQTSYIIPILIESLILLLVTFSENTQIDSKFLTILNSSGLLFAMGLQNALVTRVSQSVVRTTHLTGLFTDLGIDLSKLIFKRKTAYSLQLKKSIFLKFSIISGFFIGGVIGGYSYSYFKVTTLIIPVILLLGALWYDHLLLKYYALKRSFRNNS